VEELDCGEDRPTRTCMEKRTLFGADVEGDDDDDDDYDDDD